MPHRPPPMSEGADFLRGFEDEPTPMGVFDAETLQILAANDAALRAYGYTREELLAMKIEDLHAPEELLRLRGAVEATAVPLRWNGIWKHRRKDGSVADVSVVSHACTFEGRAAWLVAGIDVTHLGAFENAVRESEWRYRHLLENANDLIVTVDLDDRITNANAAFERILGYDRIGLVGEPITGIVPPEFHAAVGLASEAKLARAAEETRYEFEFVAQDGRRVPVEASSRLIERGGVPVGVQAICRDLTDRRDAERRHRALIDSLPLVAYEARPVGDDMETVFVSPQIESLLGYAPEEWIATGLGVELLHPDDRDRVLNDFDGAARQGRRISGEYRMIARDGRVVWVHDRQVPVLDDDGRLAYTQGFLLDVTDRQEAEGALRSSEARYRDLVENADDLIATVDLDERIMSVNAAFERLVGYPREELVGESLLRFIPEEWHASVHSRMDEKLGGETDRSVHEHELLTRGGERVPVEVWSRLFHENGRPAGVQAVLRDLRTVRHAERQRRELIERLPLVTYVQVPAEDGDELETRFISPQIEALTGLPPEAWVGTRLWEERVHPDDLVRIVPMFAEGKASATESFSCEYRIATTDGGWVWVLDTQVPERDEHGRVLRAQGFLLDVTDRHRAEEDLRASEELFRTGFQNAAIGMLMVSPEGRIVSVNAAVCDLLGYSEEELSRLDVLQLTHPDDRAASRDALERLLDGTLARFAAEKRYMRKDGTAVWVQIGVSPIRDGEGRITCFITQVVDLTAQRESEQRFRLVFESSPYGMKIVDRDGRVLAANDALARLFGCSSEELIGRTVSELSHPDDLSPALELFGELLDGTRSSYTMEKRFVCSHEKVLTTRLTTFALPDPSGIPQLAIGVLEDIGERKLLEDQLRRSQRMEAVGQLAGGISHDFNNLLTAVASYADLADAAVCDGDAERARTSIEGIRGIAARAAELTQQLLAFSRRQVLELEVVDVNDIVSEEAPMLERLLGEDVEIRLALDPELSPVMMDAGRLGQVLMNLAVNARDAMPEGGQLTIETQDVELEDAATSTSSLSGSYVLLAVSDTGAGMDAATVERIFDPFFTTKEPGKGTGLGLATVLGIVEQSGGRVAVYSEPGVGTVFKVYLPRADGAQPVRHAAAAPAGERPAGRERILLVEDNDAVRGPISEVLADLGYDVAAAATPADALELAEHGLEVDLVVTDVVMPGMTGRELAEALLARRPATKVLFMSGYTDDTVIARGSIRPGTAFLQKPFGADRLAQRVRELLDGFDP